MSIEGKRRKISTHTPSEERVGYSRAIVIDNNRVYVSGTTSIDEEGKTIGTSLYEQSDYAFNKINKVITEAGFSAHDIVLIRAYVTRMDKIGEFDEAFIKHFSEINPCCTLVGASELVQSDLLVEIECIADKG